MDLARAGAFDFRQLGQRQIGRSESVARAPAGLVDEPGGKPLLVIEQDLQKMFGRELLIAFAHGERLRALDKPARPLGVFFEIHG